MTNDDFEQTDLDYSLLRCGNCVHWTRKPGRHQGKCRRKRVERNAAEPDSLLDWPRTELNEFCANWEPVDGAAWERFHACSVERPSGPFAIN